MGFENSQKNTIWRKYFGSATQATDCFGYRISQNDFDADHIYPESKGGKTVIENAQPLSRQANQAKSDELRGVINGYRFEVIKKSNGIGEMYIDGRKVTK